MIMMMIISNTECKQAECETICFDPQASPAGAGVRRRRAGEKRGAEAAAETEEVSG